MSADQIDPKLFIFFSVSSPSPLNVVHCCWVVTGETPVKCLAAGLLRADNRFVEDWHGTLLTLSSLITDQTEQ